jgi:hypothetical protein
LENAVTEKPVVDASKSLIIDASIARAAGREKPADIIPKETTVLTPINCREILDAVRKLGFRIMMTPEIEQEWNKHQGSFATGWRAAMRTARKIDRRASCRREDLRSAILKIAGQKIGTITMTNEVCRIMLKDCHLLEAALATDKIIIAVDEKARKPMKITAQVIEDIQLIVWVNPDKAEEEAIAWLEGGAEPEPHRQLGFR